MELIYEQETYAIRGAVYEVYKNMGCGFLESVYQECLEKELARQGISFRAQQELTLFYKDEELDQKYIPDFICSDKVIVEIKSLSKLTTQHEAQIMNYLKATGIKVGLLVNFGAYPKATVKRIVL